MKILITKDYQHMSEITADIVAKLVQGKPNLAFCTPAGGSPIGMYKILVRKSEDKKIDFSKMRVCNMDEYVGLEKDHKQSYNFFVRYHFLNHIQFDEENSVFLNAMTNDLDQECTRYNQALDKLELDLAISGIGLNGHIAFNEPGEALIARTHVVDLHPTTISANSRFFLNDEEVPKQAFSIGIADLMKAKNLLIVASGKSKAAVVASLFDNDIITTHFPASFLKLHPNCTIILDHDAASMCDFTQPFMSQYHVSYID
jgi:glucosamine-6-phosphate deaminase